jgi:chromosome partitioning protein
LVLIPINPDFFAAKGLNLLLNSLKLRIEPFPIPKIGVFMNRAKRPGGSSVKKYSNETQRYLDDVQDVVGDAVKVHNLQARLFNTAIFDRAGFCSA